MTDEPCDRPVHAGQLIQDHCPVCHRDFDDTPSTLRHIITDHVGEDPQMHAVMGAYVEHGHVAHIEGVLSTVNLVVLTRCACCSAIALVHLLMAQPEARAIGGALVDETEPDRLAEVGRHHIDTTGGDHG